jgi:hypothetical protein
MEQVDFSDINQYQYTHLRDSIQEIFDDAKELYGLDVMISLFEDIKSYIKNEYDVDL